MSNIYVSGCNILVSVIIPVYNAGLVLSSCVKSVIENDYDNLEIIIIDDGSDCQTAELCDSLSNDSHLIRVFHFKNSGVSAARNQGLAIARGDYITFVDADDTVERNYLSTLVDLCESGADIAVCGYREVHGNRTLKEFHTFPNCQLHGYDILKSFFMHPYIGWNVWGKMFRASILHDVKFPEGYSTAEDMYFVYQSCCSASTLSFDAAVLYNYQKAGNSAMSLGGFNRLFDTYDLVNRVWIHESDSSDVLRKNDATCFYVRNAIWFLRLSYARGLETETGSSVFEGVRKDILSRVDPNSERMLSKARKLELVLLRYFPFAFVALSKLQSNRMR